MSKKRTKEKNKLFSVGYKEVRKRMDKRSKFLMSCRSCRYFYQGKDEDYELCHNNSVTQYDMVNTPTNFYCTFWEGEGTKNSEQKSILPRSGIEEFVMKKYRRY